MVKVVINGASGKMGQEAVKAVRAADGLELVGELGRSDHLASALSSLTPDVVVDFTVAGLGFNNTKTILEAGARPVIGTSGFTQSQVEELKAIAAEKGLGGVIAPNFALGAVLMMKFAREAVRYLPHVEILELHHDKKKDAPSGTAVRTAELLSEVRPSGVRIEGDPSPARGESVREIPVHSVRLPGFIAKQSVIFGGLSETLTIEHQSIHRESFMPGVCLACHKVMTVDTLVYGLEELL